MSTWRKAAKISLLSAGLLTHFSRGVGAILTETGAPPPLAPPREPAPDMLLDKSRLRLPVSVEPPLANVWAGLRSSLPVVQQPRVTIGSVQLAAVAATGETPPPAPAPKSASHMETTKALNTFPTLTPIQRMSIRDYIGESKNDVQEMNVNGKEVLVLRDPQSHEYRGEVSISTGTDGNVQVTKLTGATLDTHHSVEIPLNERATEEAEKTLSSKESLSSFEKNAGKLKPDETPGKELTVPAISVEAKAELGPVSESTAVFRPDGSGYEYGERTNLASVSAEAQAAISGKATGGGFAGVSGGVGSEAMKVELFANYFGKPEADEKGQFTREVIGASGDAHATLAEIAGKAGCSEEHGCGAGVSLGLLGIGTGMSLNYGAKKIGESQAEGVPAEGIGSTSSEVEAADAPELPTPPTVAEAKPVSGTASPSAAQANESDTVEPQEQAAYEAAIQDHSVSSLQRFLSEYPDSPYANSIQEKEQEIEHPDAPKPSEENKIYN